MNLFLLLLEKLMKNYEQLQENVIQFKEEHNEVISLKNQIKLLSNQNIELEHQLIQLNEVILFFQIYSNSISFFYLDSSLKMLHKLSPLKKNYLII